MISIIEHFVIICIGRFIFGFASGVLLTAAPKVIEETVPDHLQEFGFGASTNIFVMFSIMINLMLGNWIPSDGFDKENLDVDQFWKVIYLAPVVPSGLALLLNLFVHNYDSLNFHVKHHQESKALVILQKLYPEAPISEIKMKYAQLSSNLESLRDNNKYQAK